MYKKIILKEAGVLLIVAVMVLSTAIVTVNAVCPDNCPDGMISYWKGDGDADDCYGSNDGTYYGTGYVSGQVDQAFSFDGIDDYVEIPHDSSLNLGAGDFTLEAWINADQNQESFPSILSNRGDDEFNGFLFGLSLWDQAVEGSLFIQIEGTNYIPCSTDLRGTGWHHVAVTRTGSSITFYVDGSQDGTASSGKNMDSAGDMWIGWDEAKPSTTPWAGVIDEVAVYDRALSVSEISGHYNAGLDHYGYCSTDAKIPMAITDGITWLVAQQLGNGSWGNQPAYTALVLIKLQDYAYDLGYDSPFNGNYIYSSNIIAGWEYLFTPLSGHLDIGTYVRKQPIGLQFHAVVNPPNVFGENPDTNGNGYGICLGKADDPYKGGVYGTGIFLTALAASGKPNHENEGGINFDNTGGADTFGEIAQEVVDWLAFAQADKGAGEGGWAYREIDNGAKDPTPKPPDNSVSGYATLGLAAAEAITARPSATAFACTVPYWVKRELDYWIDYIQYDDTGSPLDGGSLYSRSGDGYPPNELRTGNLIFEMRFYGDNRDTSTRFKRALDFIERHWHATDLNDNPGWGYTSDPNGNHGSTTYPGNYQTMFCLMKGLQYYGIDLIDTDNSGGTPDVSWFNQHYPVWPYDDFASVIVDQQYIGHNDITGDGKDDFGCWRKDHYGDSTCILSTTWALLTLEKNVPLCGDLYISKEAPLTTPQEGIITYTINYANPTDNIVPNAYIIDYIPSGTTYVWGSASPGGVYHPLPPPPYIRWDLGDLLPGDSGSVWFEVTVNSGPPSLDSIRNNVTIYSNETLPSMASAETYLIYLDLPPDDPDIGGPIDGTAAVEYNYTIVSIDPDGERIFYFYNWDDGTPMEWIGPCESGEEVVVNHTWDEQGTYTIKVMAVNENNAKSDWATLEVTMPRNKDRIINRPILNFLQEYPNLFPILRQLLQRLYY